MFGGGIVWFYRKLAGMSAVVDNPGYKHIVYNPQPVGDVTWASYSNQTPYGLASVNWEKNNGEFILHVVVPVGSAGTVYIPASDISAISESGKLINEAPGVTFTGFENSKAVCELVSGSYTFVSKG